MALEDFVARTVSPGEPLTAQAWNEVVEALDEMNQHLLSTAASGLRVQVANVGVAPSAVRVTALSESTGLAWEAVRPIPPGTQHSFAGLQPGVYTIRAESPGFEADSRSVTVPTADVVTLTMTPRGATMPALFGRPLGEALAELNTLGIAVSRVLDVVGREVAPANPGPTYAASPVLIQAPAAGTPIAPEGRAQLAVAAALQVESTIEVPSLAGLTLAEARTALESLGLTIGRVENRQAPGS